jgi:hypothetical protein
MSFCHASQPFAGLDEDGNYGRVHHEGAQQEVPSDEDNDCSGVGSGFCSDDEGSGRHGSEYSEEEGSNSDGGRQDEFEQNAQGTWEVRLLLLKKYWLLVWHRTCM